jgi:hypothetical protein
MYSLARSTMASNSLAVVLEFAAAAFGPIYASADCLSSGFSSASTTALRR